MSGITSVVQPIFSGIADAAGSVAPTLAGAAASSLISDQQLEKQQSQREAQAAANAASKAQELSDAANEQIRQRNLTLQSGVAHAKAYFSAQGIDPTSGSPDAITSADTANTSALNDYTQTQLNNNIGDLNRSLADLQANDLLTRTQRDQNQLLSNWL